MKWQWQIKDIIDLEYFLHEDAREDLDSGDLLQKDRRLYLDRIKPDLDSNPQNADDRKWILRLWLEYQKKTAKDQYKDSILPGESFQSVFRLMLLLAGAAGFITGAGATFSFLFYQGEAPINVSAFFGIFVLLQIALVPVTALLSFIRYHMKVFHPVSITHSLPAALLGRLIFTYRKHMTPAISAKDKNRLLSAIGVVKGKQSLYGSAFYWLFFSLIQVFSVCFNVGILLAMLLKITISDLAFGWQSTIQFSAEAVYRAVTLFSLPWSWFVPPDLAHPTIGQIEGSRIVLKDGIQHLSDSGMISWWPFLCFAVFCYGLLPRVIFLVTGIIAHKRALSKIDFQTADCDQLVRNMTTPVVRTSGTPIEPFSDADSGLYSIPKDGNNENRFPGPIKGDPIISIVPDDIDSFCPEDELRNRIAGTTGHRLIQKISLGADPAGSAESIRELSAAVSDHPDAALLFLQEAWQPPIRETLLFLRLIRQTIGNKPVIRIGLIGKPRPETIFTRPDKNDVAVWKQAVTSMGDPALSVTILGGEKS